MDKKFVLRASGGREYPIVGLTRIGRDADCLIRFTDAAISRRHASLWVVQDALWLNDENSTGGVFVNDRRLTPGQAQQLYPGDRVRLSNTQIELDVALAGAPRPATMNKSTAPARRLTPIACATILGCLFLFVLVAVPSAYFFLGGGEIAGLLPGQARVLATSMPQTLLKPQEYAASSESLAQAVTQLNQSQLAFIRAAKGETSSLPKASLARVAFPLPMFDASDAQLRQVAADAFRVARMASSLNQTAAAQDGGSEQAGQVAAQYGSMAQLGAALVIEAQDLRAGLAQGSVTQATAATIIAEYGARLWNPAVADNPESPGNPFSAYLGDLSAVPVMQPLSTENAAELTNQISGEWSTWVATSDEMVTKTLTVPNAGLSIDDAVMVAAMLTAEGQANGAAAKQAAASIIQAGGGSISSGSQDNAQVTASFSSAMAVNSPDGPAVTPPRTMDVFPKGSVTVINEPSDNNIISNLINVDDKSNTTVAGQVPVQNTQPLINLSISNISISQVNKQSKDGFSTFEAEVFYEFDVTWQSNLAAPQFELDCSGGNHFEISAAGGSKRIRAKGLLILYPGAEDAYCYASRNGNTWGSASTRFLVGDAAGATQRADQVETDSVNLNLTLTADKQGTLTVGTAQAAGTQTAIAIENAVSTEVYGTQTAEFIALITEIARQTRDAPTPVDTETPLPTATFTPQLLETFFHPGDVHAVAGVVRLQPGRLYRICLSGTVYITSGPVYASDIEYVNGIKVPLSGCVVLEGDGAVARISCSKGEPAEEPGGFTVQVIDLGPY